MARRRGHRQTAATRAKISASLKGRKRSHKTSMVTSKAQAAKYGFGGKRSTARTGSRVAAINRLADRQQAAAAGMRAKSKSFIRTRSGKIMLPGKAAAAMQGKANQTYSAADRLVQNRLAPRVKGSRATFGRRIGQLESLGAMHKRSRRKG